jgi:AraC-like DNA-binding protein
MQLLDSKGNFITVIPQDALVAKHIACYYFHWSDDDTFENTFTFYPNYKHALTVYRGSAVTLGNSISTVRPGEQNSLTCLYAVNTGQSFRVDLSGKFSKTGIVFNPLGLNHFLGEALSEVFSPPFSVFNYFGEAFTSVMAQVYATSNIALKTKALDTFFKEAYMGFEEPVIKKALQEILNSNGAVHVETLSNTVGVNRKTLLRLFKKHLCSSVEEYKKMVMFRNALNYSQQAGNAVSLTDVALYSLYYDQAHFIKHFKSVTQQSPKELLHSLTRLGSQEAVYWHFEN